MDNQKDVLTASVDDLEQDIFTDSAEDLENHNENEEEANYYNLSSGDALNDEELYLLTAKKNTRIIYILGPVGSGKTTFESMIYKCFLQKIDDELLFAGSETLLGFERRLNYLRVISGNSTAKMERTNIQERRCFLHFFLRNENMNEDYSIVFSDISGEIFERCVANKMNMEEDLKNLDIAQNIVLFIDGASLLDKSRRQGAVSQLRTFLLTLKSSNLYRLNCCVDIIISKNDIIYKETKETDVSYIENIEKKFEDLKEYYNIRFFRIEALNGYDISDTKNSKPLLELLKEWLNTNDNKEITDISKKRKRTLYNDFNRFGDVE